jgi:rare lipoprotein A
MRLGFVILAVAALTPSLACAQASKSFSGRASYYDKNYKGRTASGAAYESGQFTAAHRTLPFGTRLKVTDRRTKRTIIVVVNDRGPFVRNVVLDLSYAAAKGLNMISRGVIPIEAEQVAAE